MNFLNVESKMFKGWEREINNLYVEKTFKSEAKEFIVTIFHDGALSIESKVGNHFLLDMKAQKEIAEVKKRFCNYKKKGVVN